MSIIAMAQEKGCQWRVKGKVMEAESNQSVAHAQIKVANQQTVLSNHQGEFTIHNLCDGTINLYLSHIAFKGQHHSFTIQKDTVITIFMDKKSVELEAVGVQSVAVNKNSQSGYRISNEKIKLSQGNNLSEVLANIDGVSILKTGGNISKPVLNGLFGNRLILLNNGVRHESQQWGSDHAPEIDPFAGQDIVVVKNADAVRYGPDALAGIIQINPTAIDKSRKALSNTALVLNANGKGAVLNTQLEGNIENFAYRFGVTGKKSGNLKTANYYLGNTGTEELNLNLLTEYKWKKSDFQFSLSHFSTTLGIFEGAHIGSKEDILSRIAHGRPFETYDFSYDINAPKQEVTHQLAKLRYQYKINEDSKLEAQYSFQRNHRKEFDLRRVLEDNVPMADIILSTQQLELIYKRLNTMVGISGTLQVNNNTPGTGSTPFIPNFDNHTLGAFVSQKIPLGKKLVELGIRYDYKYFDVAGYRYDYNNPNNDGSINQYLLKDQKHFNNISGIAGLSFPINSNFSWKTNMGLAWRAPSANELYSDGIHHGTGTYEIGNKALKSEKGLKWVNSLLFNNQSINAHLDIFTQVIADYIYSEPNPDSTRQTIRGTFPLFEYTQANALFYGLDYGMDINLTQDWKYELGVAIVRAKNTSTDEYLPYIPSDSYRQAIRYSLPIRKLSDSYVKIEQVFQDKQRRYTEGTDFTAPPSAYTLFNMAAGTYIKSKTNRITGIHLTVNNLFNTEYKDYMDRFRYYAHALGRNISLKINYTF
ncbi:TonB-dependent receptor [Sphingobacterium rhinopitheci]|uniref:TonB-dependent receptor n=1 Tax=Sphingobacterium rhinopitheci TaxID=2781960 RepID=UPI001F51D7D1|nr:TonB-dependent receptor [Sphingobacterium rhinopitheci]